MILRYANKRHGKCVSYFLTIVPYSTIVVFTVIPFSTLEAESFLVLRVCLAGVMGASLSLPKKMDKLYLIP